MTTHVSLTWIALLAITTACIDPGEPGRLVPRTVEDDATLPQIAINDTLLHSEAFGDPAGPVVIVLHGGPGADYRGLLGLSALADDGYRVVFWDQRGAGLSQRHDGDTIDFATYLEDLRQVIDYYAADRPVVFIGHSWGAMYATAFINEYGDYDGQIKGAILSDPGAFTDEQLRDFMDTLIGSINLVGEQFNDALWAEQFLSPSDHARADYQAALLSMRGPPSERRDPNNPLPFWRVGAVAGARVTALAEDGFDWTTNLAAFPHKVLFLRGDLDTAHTLEHQQALAASYPDAEVETIEGVGHEMIWERTADYLVHTRAYLLEIGVAP